MRSCGIPPWGLRKGHGLGSPWNCQSWALTLGHHRPWTLWKSQFWGPWARDNRYLLSDILYTAVCLRRAENKVATLEWTLAQGLKKKGQEGELRQITTGKRESWLAQVAWVGGSHGWSAGRPPGGKLFRGEPAPLLQRGRFP